MPVAAEMRRDAGLSRDFFPVVFAEESCRVATVGEFGLEASSRLAMQAPREHGPDLWRTLAAMAIRMTWPTSAGPVSRSA